MKKRSNSSTADVPAQPNVDHSPDGVLKGGAAAKTITSLGPPKRRSLYEVPK